jgi:hypothetical protein
MDCWQGPAAWPQGLMALEVTRLLQQIHEEEGEVADEGVL